MSHLGISAASTDEQVGAVTQALPLEESTTIVRDARDGRKFRSCYKPVSIKC